MIKMNNKGQSLVLFVLLLPIILGIMALVIDVGNALVEKNKQDNTIELVLEIAKEDNLELSKIQQLINNNLKNSNNTVSIEGETITIISNTKVKGIFSRIFNFDGLKVTSEYSININNDKTILNKKR